MICHMMESMSHEAECMDHARPRAWSRGAEAEFGDIERVVKYQAMGSRTQRLRVPGVRY